MLPRRDLLAVGLCLALACKSADKEPPAVARETTLTAPKNPPAALLLITSPREGDRLIEGNTYIIRWRASGVTNINLGAAVGGKEKGLLLNNATATTDSLVWTIPVGFISGFGPDSSTEVRLRLEDASSPSQYVEAGPFTIVARP